MKVLTALREAAYSVTFRLILVLNSFPARFGWDRLVLG